MRYTFYVDEAGDEGIGTGGTQWFLIGGIIVRQEGDLAVSRAVNRVKEAIGQRDPRKALHWREIRNHNKRLFLVKEFSALPIRLIVCAMHKPSLKNPTRFSQKQWLYNYVTRHVIERVSWLVRDETNGQGRVDMIFENRTNLSYADLTGYIDRKVKPHPEVADAVLGSLVPRTKDQSKNLQIADICLGTCFSALEPNDFGMTDVSYIQLLRGCFYRRNGNLQSYGLKLLPFDFATGQREELAWLRDF